MTVPNVLETADAASRSTLKAMHQVVQDHLLVVFVRSKFHGGTASVGTGWNRKRTEKVISNKAPDKTPANLSIR